MILLGDTFIKNKYYLTKKSSNIFKNNIKVINFECSVDSNELHSKLGPKLLIQKHQFKLFEDFADVFCLANNHSSDSGFSGLRSTLNCIKKSNSLFCGIKNNEYVDVLENNCKIRIYSITDCFYGNLAVLSDIYAINNFSLLKSEADYFVINVHMGIESSSYISPAMEILANRLENIGFDFIFFHHSHLSSGFDKIGNAHVFYGLGNFIFDYQNNKPGICVLLEFHKTHVSFSIFNIFIEDYKVTLQPLSSLDKPKLINNSASKKYFKEHISFHFAMVTNFGLRYLSSRDFLRYLYYKSFGKSLGISFIKMLREQFKINSTYNYFYEWYNTYYRRNR